MNSNHEIIQALAYDLYRERNGGDGSAVEDWLNAEREVKKVNAAKIEKNLLFKNPDQRTKVEPLPPTQSLRPQVHHHPHHKK